MDFKKKPANDAVETNEDVVELTDDMLECVTGGVGGYDQLIIDSVGELNSLRNPKTVHLIRS